MTLSTCELDLCEKQFHRGRLALKSMLLMTSVLAFNPTVATAQTSITTNQNSAGAVQTYTVPTGIVCAQVTAKGGDGGTDPGNFGAAASSSRGV